MVPETYFLINGYKGPELAWSLALYKFSALAKFVLATEEFRVTESDYTGEFTVIIEKAYRDFSQYNCRLENYGSNNEKEVLAIADALLNRQN